MHADRYGGGLLGRKPNDLAAHDARHIKNHEFAGRLRADRDQRLHPAAAGHDRNRHDGALRNHAVRHAPFIDVVHRGERGHLYHTRAFEYLPHAVYAERLLWSHADDHGNRTGPTKRPHAGRHPADPRARPVSDAVPNEQLLRRCIRRECRPVRGPRTGNRSRREPRVCRKQNGALFFGKHKLHVFPGLRTSRHAPDAAAADTAAHSAAHSANTTNALPRADADAGCHAHPDARAVLERDVRSP